jgi:hypothetical protein
LPRQPEPVRCSTCEPDGDCQACEPFDEGAWLAELEARISTHRAEWRKAGKSRGEWPWIVREGGADVDLISGLIGACIGGTVCTIAVGALCGGAYDRGYERGFESGRQQGITDASNRTGWMMESVAKLQTANRELAQELALRRVQLGKAVAELDELRAERDAQTQVLAALNTATRLAAEADSEVVRH